MSSLLIQTSRCNGSAEMSWHPFAEKFPLLEGEEYEALKASVRKTGGIDEQPILFRIVDGKEQGLDGRNRFRACLDLGIEPAMQRVDIPDAEVKDFILRRNVHRRHLTRELRQQIVADLREEGQSTRRIAATLGISQATVRNDLDSGEQNCSPAIVVGKDGKIYQPVKPKPKKAEPQLALKDANGTTVPKWLRDAFGSAEALEDMARRAESLGAYCKSLVNSNPYIRIEFTTTKLKEVAVSIRDAIPYVVCPKCDGKSGGCGTCYTCGWMTQPALVSWQARKDGAK